MEAEPHGRKLRSSQLEYQLSLICRQECGKSFATPLPQPPVSFSANICKKGWLRILLHVTVLPSLTGISHKEPWRHKDLMIIQGVAPFLLSPTALKGGPSVDQTHCQFRPSPQLQNLTSHGQCCLLARLNPILPLPCPWQKSSQPPALCHWIPALQIGPLWAVSHKEIHVILFIKNQLY